MAHVLDAGAEAPAATQTASRTARPAYQAYVILHVGFAVLPLLGRILLSQIFLISGVMKLVDWPGTEAKMAEQGMFWIPFFHVAALLTELAGGLSLFLGFKARLGALLLFLFLIPVTLTFHSFWTYTDPKEQHVNMLFFMHNLTLMGGLLLVMTIGPGPKSVDLWRRSS